MSILIPDCKINFLHQPDIPQTSTFWNFALWENPIIGRATNAESLGLTKIKEWERLESGQGKRNSGKFSMYYAFDHRIEVMAEEKKLQPIDLLEYLWFLESIGVAETPKMEIRRSKFGKTRLSQNLRFFSDESERPVTSRTTHPTKSIWYQSGRKNLLVNSL